MEEASEEDWQNSDLGLSVKLALGKESTLVMVRIMFLFKLNTDRVCEVTVGLSLSPVL